MNKILLYTDIIITISVIMSAINIALIVYIEKDKIHPFKKKLKSKPIILEEYEMLIVDLGIEYINNNNIDDIETVYNAIAEQLCYELAKENIDLLKVDKKELLSYIESTLIINNVFSNRKNNVEDNIEPVLEEPIAWHKSNTKIPKNTTSLESALNNFSNSDDYR